MTDLELMNEVAACLPVSVECGVTADAIAQDVFDDPLWALPAPKVPPPSRREQVRHAIATLRNIIGNDHVVCIHTKIPGGMEYSLTRTGAQRVREMLGSAAIQAA
jgi:hypothetical protein